MLGIPAQVLLCIVPDKNTGNCQKLVFSDGLCKHHWKVREKKKNQDIIEEKERIRIEAHDKSMETERLKISTLIKSIPEYKIDITTTESTGEYPWIWHNIQQYYGQFDENGNLMVRCTCCACSPSETVLSYKQKQIMHCVYCNCKQCVCGGREKTGRFGEKCYTMWWDNPCGGTCPTCEQYYEDRESCVII